MNARSGSSLWAASGRLDGSTRVASRMGGVVAMALLAYGGVRGFSGDPIGGLWLVLIGLFLHGAARSSEDLVTVRTRLERRCAEGHRLARLPAAGTEPTSAGERRRGGAGSSA